MTADAVRDYEAAARAFMAARTDTGLGKVRRWAATLPRISAVLDIGAGHGVPTSALVEAGHAVTAIEPAPALAAALRRRLPSVAVDRTPAQRSATLDRSFGGVLMIGVLFLLSAEEQRVLLARACGAVAPGGSLLFTAPRERASWTDSLTGTPSRSLGEAAYRRVLGEAGLSRLSVAPDEGGNDHFEAWRGPDAPPTLPQPIAPRGGRA